MRYGDAIGGYFELELADRGGFPHDDGYCVNSGRNALELILSTLADISRLWIPYYTCEVILEPLEKLEIPYSFYHINCNLELRDDINLKKGEYLLLTNYFGIKDHYVEKMASRYGKHLIVDNSQAFFCDPVDGIKTFYSPRKFVGVPDGGIAIIPDNEIDMSVYEQDCSFDRCSHLLKRIDKGATEGYSDFKNNSQLLKNQPMSRMSRLTTALLRSIDFELIKAHRLRNLKFLHENLGDKNQLKCADECLKSSCPMIYPLMTSRSAVLRQKLIGNKIFVATYWPNVKIWSGSESEECSLTERILALPLDQRYSPVSLKKIMASIY